MPCVLGSSSAATAISQRTPHWYGDRLRAPCTSSNLTGLERGLPARYARVGPGAPPSEPPPYLYEKRNSPCLISGDTRAISRRTQLAWEYCLALCSWYPALDETSQIGFRQVRSGSAAKIRKRDILSNLLISLVPVAG